MTVNRSYIHYFVAAMISVIVGLSAISQSLSEASPLVSQMKANGQQPASSLHHEIKMATVELPQGQIAYKMLEYKMIDKQNQVTDITSRYSRQATIPGPTIVVTEGDSIKLTLLNEMDNGMVSIHTHGVHYKITSDGTLKEINQVSDQGATPENSVTYEWDAANGTVGSWPFHDHTLAKNTFGKNMNGLETLGLFATVIVNPANGKVNALINGIPNQVNIQDIDKEFVLYVTDDVFWGDEIDNSNNYTHTPLWMNPTLVAANNDIVRFHLLSIGNEFHNFVLDGYQWLKPGTNKLINSQIIGPLENHVFTISSDKDSQYFDTTEINLLAGMKGKFDVNQNVSQAFLEHHHYK